MDKKKFLFKLEELMEMDENTLSGQEKLADLEDWDSLAVMSFIAMVDKDFGITLEADLITNCKTIDDLAGLLDDRITE